MKIPKNMEQAAIHSIPSAFNVCLNNLNNLNKTLNNNDEFALAIIDSIPPSALDQGILPQGALKVIITLK